MRKLLFTALAASFLVTAGFDLPSYAAAASGTAGATDSSSATTTKKPPTPRRARARRTAAKARKVSPSAEVKKTQDLNRQSLQNGAAQ